MDLRTFLNTLSTHTLIAILVEIDDEALKYLHDGSPDKDFRESIINAVVNNAVS